MRLKCLLLWIVIVLMYTITSLYVFQMYIKGNKKLKIQLPPKKLIILVSQPRSGSTYLSNIISKAFKSIFFYEPLYQLDDLLHVDSSFVSKEDRYEYDIASTTYLQNILKCQFREKKDWKHIFLSPFSHRSKLKGGECSAEETLRKHNNLKTVRREGYRLDRCMPYFNPYHLEKDCQKFNLMVKLLETRLPKKNLKKLATFIDKRTSYKIIYLLRDPRASFWSLLRTGWISNNEKSKNFQTHVELRCSEMYENIQAIKRSRQYIVVRFEDIMVKPKEALVEFYQFIDDDIAKQIHSQLLLNYCYVPQFNNWYNKTLGRSRRSTEKQNKQNLTLIINNRGDKQDGDKHFGVNKKLKEEKMNEIDELEMKKQTEKHKQNYECFSINKWRYTVSRYFIELIEGKCSKVMTLMGYKLIGNRHHITKNVKEAVVADMMLDV